MIDTNLADAATSAKSTLFGDFSAYRGPAPVALSTAFLPDPRCTWAATSTDVAPSRTVAPPEPPGNTVSSRFGGFLEAIETVPQVLIPGPGSGAREGTIIAHQAVNAASFQPMNRTCVVSVEDLAEHVRPDVVSSRCRGS